jgi:two-component system response regulator HydG
MQVDLLRVLDEKRISPIGSNRSIEVDFRLISATRRNLEKAIENKTFRPDFFYRINVIVIRIPPLRKRKEDIPLLVRHFAEKYSQETAKQVHHVDDDALTFLGGYDWPGNVRELENAVERAIVLSRSSTLRPADFSFLQFNDVSSTRNMSLRENEKEHIRRILAECRWNVTRAARTLEISRSTLHRKMKNYGLGNRNS